MLVTGSTDGIGKHTAALLAQQGATTLVHGRNRSRVQRTLRELRSHTGNPRVFAYNYDMSSLAQTRAFADHLRRDLVQHFDGRWVRGWRVSGRAALQLVGAGLRGQVSCRGALPSSQQPYPASPHPPLPPAGWTAWSTTPACLTRSGC